MLVRSVLLEEKVRFLSSCIQARGTELALLIEEAPAPQSGCRSPLMQNWVFSDISTRLTYLIPKETISLISPPFWSHARIGSLQQSAGFNLAIGMEPLTHEKIQRFMGGCRFGDPGEVFQHFGESTGPP